MDYNEIAEGFIEFYNSKPNMDDEVKLDNDVSIRFRGGPSNAFEIINSKCKTREEVGELGDVINVVIKKNDLLKVCNELLPRLLPFAQVEIPETQIFFHVYNVYKNCCFSTDYWHLVALHRVETRFNAKDHFSNCIAIAESGKEYLLDNGQMIEKEMN